MWRFKATFIKIFIDSSSKSQYVDLKQQIALIRYFKTT